MTTSPARKALFATLLILAGLAPPQATPQTSVSSQRSAGCQPSASRARESCEPTKTVVSTVSELSVTFDLPPVKTAQCAATVELEYTQRDTRVSVEGTLDHRDCAASSGEYKIEVRVRGQNRESETIEFVEQWRRVGEEPVRFSADYPIGENVDLVGVRSRQLRCTCDEPASEPPRSSAEPLP